MRIDKYLWCIRVYKTRSLATEACKGGKVIVNDNKAKPAAEVKAGDKIKVRYLSVYKSYVAKGFPKSRVSAKTVSEFAEDITDPKELEKLKIVKENQGVFRQKGSGRPTKKDRRDIGKFFEEY